ncbi:Type IV pilus biogenesis protein PilE [Candidatus Nitrotoga sp. HW29]|uniref:type IV pilin protein n=1 Tax=Candidatus Nitrotoga sp. HW29 TaxID=2886963 RepID=UPI001FA511A2|nr:type IV pilin protein [Candidatus Nitrotoga sp. HW29]CAH1903691.1 Type IV pilus biogenesis protein PilE [Candidatus Nitrotoga sp. HW29]
MRVHKIDRHTNMVTPVQLALRAMPKCHPGFTLIELMVTVTIIGILSAIAYPSYTQYVLRANRAEARAILLESVQFFERNYTTANRYDQTSAGAAIVLPYLTSPKTGTAKYNITAAYDAAPAQTFTLSATPTGVMSGDTCGTYTLDNAGIQGSGGTLAECWGK